MVHNLPKVSKLMRAVIPECTAMAAEPYDLSLPWLSSLAWQRIRRDLVRHISINYRDALVRSKESKLDKPFLTIRLQKTLTISIDQQVHNTEKLPSNMIASESSSQLAPLETSIAIRPEYIADSNTTIVVKQREYTSLGRDFTVYDQNVESTLFAVKATSISKSQRRCFEDASGSPLFDLRRHLLSKSKHWYLYRPGENDNSLMTAAIRCSLTLGLKLTVKNACTDGSDIVLDVLETGSHGVTTRVIAGGSEVATITRTAADGSSSEGLTERMSFRKRPIWTIQVAKGMDLCLAAVIGVICAEHYPEYHFVIT